MRMFFTGKMEAVQEQLKKLKDVWGGDVPMKRVIGNSNVNPTMLKALIPFIKF